MAMSSRTCGDDPAAAEDWSGGAAVGAGDSATVTTRAIVLACGACLLLAHAAGAQTVSQRGFVDAAGTFLPQVAPHDTVKLAGDFLVREEIFVKPSPWLQFAAGIDLRANTHDQVDFAWRVDFSDRGRLRPAIAVRRLSATVSHGPFTLDAGKQFIRWGATDILTPTDWFAPRDYMNVFDNEFLPVLGARGSVRLGENAIEGVWVPRFTPSRIPLFDQRWFTPPPGAPASILDGDPVLPGGAQTGVRWSHVGSRLEFAAAFFNGFNNLPNIEVAPPLSPASLTIARHYPSIRSYGADAAVPARWFTIKLEGAYFTSDTPHTDDYLLYVAQLERQQGEWTFVGGYAGEEVTARRADVTFAPDRGLTKAFVGRVSYTIDTKRSFSFDGAARQNGHGAYGKAEYSQTRGQHWRATITVVGIAGRDGDFFGQYRRNSHVMFSARYSL
jgi:hypothetical protein